MSDLPAPLVPPDCDLTDFSFMPLDVRRLLTSETWVLGTAEEKVAALTLWSESWHQVPAASLPDNDRMLAHLSQAGARWSEIKEHVMRGWIQCADGRLYHPVVAEKARDAFAKKEKQRERSKRGNEARWGRRGEQSAPSHAEPSRGGSRADATAEPQDHIRDERVSINENTPPIPQGSKTDPIRMPQRSFRESFKDPKGQGQGQKERYMSEPDGSDASVPIGSVSRDLPDEGTPPCAAASPDGPPAPAAPRKRLAYPVEFDALWAAYPTDQNMSKSKALDAWKRLGPDDRRAAMASIPGFRAYCRKNPTYRPVHLVRFITDRRFDGFMSTPAPPGSATPAVGAGELTPEQRKTAQRSLVRDWQSSPFGWPYKLGPKPDEPGCRISPEILAEFGLGPIAQNRIRDQEQAA